MTDPQIPERLLAHIRDGRCIAFVGAGFSAAARLPGWRDLLLKITDRCGGDDYVTELLAPKDPTASALDRAAQLLADRMPRADFIELVRTQLGRHQDTVTMRQRLAWLRGIPFRAIVTTNFDGLIHGALPPGPEAYRAVFRDNRVRWWDEAFWRTGHGAPVVALHGDLTGPPPSWDPHFVLTRRDYRRRLYQDPHYRSFLHSLLATHTILFMGFSFTDAYLNEIRSQVLALFDYHFDGHTPPLAYALINDVPPPLAQHFRHHEGIEILSFDSRKKTYWAPFDHTLATLFDQTAIGPRFGRLLHDKRILWVDSHAEFNRPAFEFLRQVAPNHEVIRAQDAETVIARGSLDYDLIITHWGYQGPDDSTALHLLRWMRQQPEGCPLVIFSLNRDADMRKAQALRLGAQAYCFDWGPLFQHIDRILGPTTETS